MGIERFRSKERDDGYTNVDVIKSNLRKPKFRWWFENDIPNREGPFSDINVDTTYDNTNRRIAVIDE